MSWSSYFFHFFINNVVLMEVFIENFFLILFIVVMVLTSVVFLISSSSFFKGLTSHPQMETFWLVVPSIALLIIGIPSLKALYFMEEFSTPVLTIKVMGNQWYWSYEYSTLGISFDSFMLPATELKLGMFYNLEVDNSLVLPFNNSIQTLISSNDVIHSWSVPSLGIKVDANPSRLNSVTFESKFPGLFYGFCSEICGANHSFMPIKVEFVSPSSFISNLK